MLTLNGVNLTKSSESSLTGKQKSIRVTIVHAVVQWEKYRAFANPIALIMDDEGGCFTPIDIGLVGDWCGDDQPPAQVAAVLHLRLSGA